MKIVDFSNGATYNPTIPHRVYENTAGGKDFGTKQDYRNQVRRLSRKTNSTLGKGLKNS